MLELHVSYKTSVLDVFAVKIFGDVDNFFTGIGRRVTFSLFWRWPFDADSD